MPTPDFNELRRRNPYSEENRAQYNMGAIEKLMHDTFGFRTGVDKYNEEMTNRANEYDAQLASIEREEQYNSPDAQAARLRAAGINPDINGEVTPGQASEMSEPDLSPESPIGTDMETLQTMGEGVAKLGMNLLSILATGSTTIATVANTLQDIDTKDLKLGQDLVSYVPQLHSYFEELSQNNEAITGTSLPAVKLRTSLGEKWARSMGLNRRNAKHLVELYNFMHQSTPTRIEQKKRRNEETELDVKQFEMEQTKKVEEVMFSNQLQREEINAKYLKAEAELYEEFPNIPKDLITGAKNIEAMELGTEVDEQKARRAQAKYLKLKAEEMKEIAELDYATIKKYNEDYVSGRINSHYRSDTQKYYGAMGRQYGGTRGTSASAFGFGFGEKE